MGKGPLIQRKDIHDPREEVYWSNGDDLIHECGKLLSLYGPVLKDRTPGTEEFRVQIASIKRVLPRQVIWDILQIQEEFNVAHYRQRIIAYVQQMVLGIWNVAQIANSRNHFGVLSQYV